MADCVSLLDEELSSFVFNYLTENSGSPYGEEEVCSDHLDTDFPDFDLSQLDASDFDSVNCLSELHWCNDHSDSSPASIQYSVGDAELFETEEDNAALLAALTDSLDGIVEDGVGELSVFPSLGGDPVEEEEEEEEDELLLESEPVQGSLSPETEDPSLLKKLLLSPPNVPVGLDLNKLSSALSKTQQLKSVRPVLKRDRTCTVERKPRAFRPVSHLCTELHRHLTQEANTEDTPAADTEEEGEEEEEDEDSDSDDEEGEDEEEEESSSSSEVECTVYAEPLQPQFPSEKERHSVVELIRYMHTYCVPSRKQASWDRKERENVARKTKPENPAVPRIATPSCVKPATLPNALYNSSTTRTTKPKIPFVRRRETKAHSLLKELLEAVASFDVSKPYRLHSPPYIHSRTTAARPKAEHKDTSVIEGSQVAAKRPKCPEIDEGSFSVRRSRRLASFPSRFGKRLRPSGHSNEEESAVRHPPVDSAEDSIEKADSQKSPETPNLCCNDEKRACLCLPLTPKSTGDPRRPYEQTLCVELCGTAGLTPPTTPPHKPVDEELFKPEGKADLPGKSLCPVRTHLRKLPEQTELYAQLRRMGPTGEIQSKGAYRDHDYCMLNLGESHKRIASILPVSVCYTKDQEEEEDKMGEKNRQEETEGQQADLHPDFSPHQPAETGQPSPACTPTPEADSECPDSCQPPSPCHQINLSCESHCDKQSNNTTHGQEEDGDKCQVLYIHNLPSSVTQAVLRKRFKAFGEPEDCRVLVKKEERCGVITFRQNQNELNQKHRQNDSVGQYAGIGSRRFSRKRYIDLDEAGPGPVKSKYDAMDFDTLLKEAQRSLHR